MNQSTKRISQLKNIFLICTKTFIQYQRNHCSQGCRKIDNWGGAMFIYSCSAQLISFEIVIQILNSIVFTVCEHEYINIAPPPVIDLPAL